jgi:tetratricopeptide (TPR) repeat protein
MLYVVIRLIPLCTYHTELKMERSQQLFLSLVLFFLLFSCKTKEERIGAAMEFGKHAYYQGTPTCMKAFAHILEIDPTNTEAYRELSIPYLKRGIPHEWEKWMKGAIQYDAIKWQSYRGYNYLWFYRDYQRAIADFNASDTLTPYLDYPQGHSVDFWWGIAYLRLKDYENSIGYWNKHITKETEDTGEDWLELEAFLYRGIAYYEAGKKEKAVADFDKAIHYFKHTADSKYYEALILKEQGEIEAALALTKEAVLDFNTVFYNNRAYVETLHQIYREDLEELKDSLTK